MPPAVLGVIALIAVIVIVFFVLRARGASPSQLEGSKPEPLPEPTKAEPAKVKPAKAEPAKAEPAAVEPAKAEPARAEPAKAEPAAVEPARAEPAAVEPARAEPAKAEPAAVEPAKAEPAKAEPARAEPAAVEPPRQTSAAVEATTAPQKAPKRDVSALQVGLQSARTSWVQRLVGIFSGKKELDPELATAIEEVLLTGDVGIGTTEKLLAAIKERLGKKDLGQEAVVWQTLRDISREVIELPAPAFGHRKGSDGPLVILVVGVNGVGKTTTIGKLAARYKEQGKKVYLAAGDTFRAAAVSQLELWGKRVGVHTVKGKDLSKPSAVVYEAVQAAVKDGADVVIADTAGRLHTKTPLMDELKKLGDAAGKAFPGAPHEILLVLDATTGQNAVVQVSEFKNALPISGIVLTKLDGTAKGGVILSICDEHKIPVRFIGVGEKVDDLRAFDAEDFTEALFSSPSGDDRQGTA
jgi:fused signal recognition particle receptor